MNFNVKYYSFAIDNDNNMAYDILTNGTKLYLYEISVHSAAKLLCRKAQFLNNRRQNVLRFIIVITIINAIAVIII